MISHTYGMIQRNLGTKTYPSLYKQKEVLGSHIQNNDPYNLDVKGLSFIPVCLLEVTDLTSFSGLKTDRQSENMRVWSGMASRVEECRIWLREELPPTNYSHVTSDPKGMSKCFSWFFRSFAQDNKVFCGTVLSIAFNSHLTIIFCLE